MGIKQNDNVDITCDLCNRKVEWGDKVVELTSSGWGAKEVACLSCLAIEINKENH